jgi:hypothetical protein
VTPELPPRARATLLSTSLDNFGDRLRQWRGSRCKRWK